MLALLCVRFGFFVGGVGWWVGAVWFLDCGFGWCGVAWAFGLACLALGFSVGQLVSGQFNPAGTIGLLASGRFPAKEVVGYVIAQVVGGIV
ncbi:aquaporin, partial [Escherichia coli]|uniref:aquaporin n=1 Tax=Escherichia coli TaxID=562 RepID=UPI0014854E98